MKLGISLRARRTFVRGLTAGALGGLAFATSAAEQGQLVLVHAADAQTASTQYELAVSVAPGIAPRSVVLGTKGELLLRDRAQVQAPISNLGLGVTELGVEVKAADVYSEPNLVLRDRARVDGAAQVKGTVQNGNATVITGGVTTGVSFADPAGKSFLIDWPSGTGADHDMQPGQSLTLAAGVSYGNVIVKSRATLVVTPGDHFVQSLQVEPDANVVLQNGGQRIAVYVKTAFTWRGKLTNQQQGPVQWLVGYLGTQRVPVESPFTGLIVAPSAELTLARVNGNVHTGQFFAKKIEVHPDTRIVYQASDFFAESPGGYVRPGSTYVGCQTSISANGHVVENGVDRWTSLSFNAPTPGCPEVRLCTTDSVSSPVVSPAALNARLQNPSTPKTACIAEGARLSQECPVDPSSINRAQACNADTDCPGYKTGAFCAEYCVDSACVQTARGCATRYDCTGADSDSKGCDVEAVYQCTAAEDVGATVPAEVRTDLPPLPSVNTQPSAVASVKPYLSMATSTYCSDVFPGGGTAENGTPYVEPSAQNTPDAPDAVSAEQDSGSPVNLGSSNWGLFANPRLFHRAKLGQTGLDTFDIDLVAEGSLTAGARVLSHPITALDVKGRAAVTQCGVSTFGKFQLFGETIAGIGGTDQTSTTCTQAFAVFKATAQKVQEVALLVREAKELLAGPDSAAKLCGLIKGAYGFGPPGDDFECSAFTTDQLFNLLVKKYEEELSALATQRASFLAAAVGAEKTSGTVPLFDYGETFSVVGVHTTFPIGPLSVVVDAQVYGNWFLRGGIDYELDMGSLSGGQVSGDPKAKAGARITPGVGLTGSLYVGVGIDFGIAGASVGLEGILKLVEVDAPVRVSISVQRQTVSETALDPSHDYATSDFAGDAVPGIPVGKAYKWTGAWDFGAAFGLASMEGQLNAAARVHFLFFSKTFRKKIADWDGFPKEYFPIANAGGSISLDQQGLLSQTNAFAGALGFGNFADQIAFTKIARVGTGEAAALTLPNVKLAGCVVVK